jgi:beta-fructofuranosidase
MLVGSGLREQGGTALLYCSTDLRQWEYVHPLLVGDMHATQPFTGVMWECPDFFPLDGQHVLIVSVFDKQRPNQGAPIDVIHHSVYFAGDYIDHRLVPSQQGMVDYGGSWYAPQSFTDNQGRRVMFGWLREERTLAAQLEAGWSGAMSLPRVLRLRPDGRLAQQPAPEVERLRGRASHWASEPLAPAAPLTLDISGNTLELTADIALGDATQIGLAILATPDALVGQFAKLPQDAEATYIVYDRTAQQLSFDTTASSLDSATRRAVWRAPLALAEDEPLRLRVFIDRSVVEIFANNDLCLTGRVYPTRADALGISVSADGGPALLKQLDVWEMAAIW